MALGNNVNRHIQVPLRAGQRGILLLTVPQYLFICHQYNLTVTTGLLLCLIPHHAVNTDE
jgi:hypothetical protein